ncbi:MAG: hypothetical protein ABSB60_04420 [Terracidiphilus sp.]
MNELLTEIIKSPQALVGWSAFLATFVASVMADEQNDRLRQGTFGAIAGASVGGLASIMEKDGTLLLVGVFGSATGAIVGWIVYLGLSVLASRKWARGLVEYQVSGLKGVKARIDLEDRNLLLRALTIWSQNFRGMVLRETQVILSNTASADYNCWVSVALRGWLTSLVDAFNLVLDALAEKEEYRSRITLIVFGAKEDGSIAGRHWISYSGNRDAHTRTDFGVESIAYQVVSGEKASPFFTSVERANRDGQKRGDDSYSSFFVFRLGPNSALSLDWPGKIEEKDPYISIARSLLYLDVAPAIGKLLNLWHRSLAAEVDLTEPTKPGTKPTAKLMEVVSSTAS